MAEHAQLKIPVLTEIMERSRPGISPSEAELLIAELQTRLAAGTFELTDALLRRTMAEMEAQLYERVSARLRTELPELIDRVLRDQLTPEDGSDTASGVPVGQDHGMRK
jgi:hypothetical protein